MPNEMKSAFDGFREGVRDTLDPALKDMAEGMAKTMHDNFSKAFMPEEATLHMIWLTIAEISAAKVRVYRKEQEEKEDE